MFEDCYQPYQLIHADDYCDLAARLVVEGKRRAPRAQGGRGQPRSGWDLLHRRSLKLGD